MANSITYKIQPLIEYGSSLEFYKNKACRHFTNELESYGNSRITNQYAQKMQFVSQAKSHAWSDVDIDEMFNESA